ncbi:hypothetical protein Vadar_029373 [Vaccinium darrowii]|uniref:Uncharacterized protein n=1 Tax=Vaccinium darrowii TaxID=229202 RepID=A0ACB7ZF81_9ERIC|nr:hypothetical protein Vadar_029373 [Vaccinium darrowii]
MTVEVDRRIVRVSNIPQTATSKDLFDFFNSALGNSFVYAIEITIDRKNWKSRGFGRVQFDTLAAKLAAIELSSNGNLAFKGSHLSLPLLRRCRRSAR